jgi:murein DD-endopeptidase MepM/ murein hydrolase activator NlpD
MYVTPVAGAEIFIFSQPDTSSDRLKTIEYGTPLEVVGQDINWYQIKYQDVHGWVPQWMTFQISTDAPIVGFYLSWPTDYPVITQGFGVNPQAYAKFGLPGHEGLDIKAPMDSNVYACVDGVVYMVHDYTTDNHPYGRHVRVDHHNGYYTIYAHLDSIAVTLNQEVKRKQVIGLADSTGNSTGSHLHLTLKHLNATANKETNFPNDIIDPSPFLRFE